MVLLSTSTEPSAYGLGGSGGIPSKGNVVLTYPVHTSASVSKGDFVMLNSTTTNAIVKCTSTSDNPIGIAFTDVDNTSGTVTALGVSDKYCAVMRDGFAYVTAVNGSSGNQGKQIGFDEVLYLVSTSATCPLGGQALSSSGDGATVVARSFDRGDVPTTGTAYNFHKIRVYIDRLSKAVIVA